MSHPLQSHFQQGSKSCENSDVISASSLTVCHATSSMASRATSSMASRATSSMASRATSSMASRATSSGASRATSSMANQTLNSAVYQIESCPSATEGIAHKPLKMCHARTHRVKRATSYLDKNSHRKRLIVWLLAWLITYLIVIGSSSPCFNPSIYSTLKPIIYDHKSQMLYEHNSVTSKVHTFAPGIIRYGHQHAKCADDFSNRKKTYSLRFSDEFIQCMVLISFNQSRQRHLIAFIMCQFQQPTQRSHDWKMMRIRLLWSQLLTSISLSECVKIFSRILAIINEVVIQIKPLPCFRIHQHSSNCLQTTKYNCPTKILKLGQHSSDYFQTKYCPTKIISKVEQCGGGLHRRPVRRTSLFYFHELQNLGDIFSCNAENNAMQHYRFHGYDKHYSALNNYGNNTDIIFVDIPLHLLALKLPSQKLFSVARKHGLQMKSRANSNELTKLLTSHSPCQSCNSFVSIFQKHASAKVQQSKKKVKLEMPMTQPTNLPETFPPAPPTREQLSRVINNFCKEQEYESFAEQGCMVCGLLVPMKNLVDPSTLQLNILNVVGKGITRKERLKSSDPVEELHGPIILSEYSKICMACNKALSNNKIPKFSLANGGWIGNVPDQLKNLTYAEKLLIPRVRHNNCIVRVSKSGMHKMHANAILWTSPIAKVYQKLPPTLQELDEVIAFIFTGPCAPTQEDFGRTPLLVRRNKIHDALKWLQLNHCDYSDIEIDQESLNSYPEYGIPVTVGYSKMETNVSPESIASYDNDPEIGTDSGSCPFVVHGLTGEDLATMTPEQIKARSLKNLKDNGKWLAIGHSEAPQSTYDNPQLYPLTFPWLFPYGLGGIGNRNESTKLSEIQRKKNLLLYHDKRFQLDEHFPFIAFNHEQIKGANRGANLLVKKDSFEQIARKVTSIDHDTLADLVKRLDADEKVTPKTEAEKKCFSLINELDAIGSHIQGSRTNRRYMRNEIWSLINYHGSPTWFITISPADVNHPICLYFADQKQRFSPEILDRQERFKLIANNPVAGARFFDFTIKAFLKHVLGVGQDAPGIYGKTKAYYGTVEQQGRLTLHLHLLLWITGALSPQEIRDRIMDNKSDFQKAMVEYLEQLNVGQFITGTKQDVHQTIVDNEEQGNYSKPTLTMAHPVPDPCQSSSCHKDNQCSDCLRWWDEYHEEIDDLLFRSNLHSCEPIIKGRPSLCTSNPWKTCKARFPREVRDHTTFDKETGALQLKKGEPMMNNVTPVLTYLMRCNTDVASLLSGTAVKAVVAYAADYITKMPLKSHTMLNIIKNVFDKNEEFLDAKYDRQVAARKLMTKMINQFTAKLEIGGPMASLFLLGNVDHYTDHQFKTFYWKSFYNFMMKSWPCIPVADEDHLEEEKVVLGKDGEIFIPLSPITDYTCRPLCFEHLSLYDWVRKAKKVKINEDGSNQPSAGKSNSVGTKRKQSTSLSGRLLAEHPQAKTHKIIIFPETMSFVPNILGFPLPRRDQGDREAYCSTMLMLFKPWRTGLDLKCLQDTWESTFQNHSFELRQIKLMDNFHLRYECNDARDDFSAKRKQLNEPFSFNFDSIQGGDEYLEDSMGEGWKIPEDTVKWSAFGALYNKMQKIQLEMENILIRSGWLQESIDGLPIINDLNHFIDGDGKRRTEWSSIIKEARLRAIEDRQKQPVKVANAMDVTNQYPRIPNEVKVVDQHSAKYHLNSSMQQTDNTIQDIVDKFTLNKAQKRALSIVINHASHRATTHLKMHLGGIGGTGKSRVIEALKYFFQQRGESHRLLILAPTGASAALIGGSTYHSVLGFRDSLNIGNNPGSLSALRGKLLNVDYIFIDEISMISCQEMYNISSRLCKALNEPEKPFGGINFILSGDFGQLPPPMNRKPLYSSSVGTMRDKSSSWTAQENVLGKALWHQVTTVVILRENMRQMVQSQEDANFRIALENLRYKDCTKQDLALLRSRIAGVSLQHPSLSQKRFRHISVITARNLHRDKINIMGAQKFAKDTKQTLSHFYSFDQWKPPNEPIKQVWKRKKTATPMKIKRFSEEEQEILWSIPPSYSEHFAGKLSICLGMPILLKKNEATECCITNGAEGTIVGWNSSLLENGKAILETLFVKLTNPPMLVKITNLPDNIIPIPRSSISIQCTLPNGEMISINRNQVAVLPNFAMTDFCSQGRTRPNNVVDINQSRNHQSIYTCLSRGSSLQGTILVQGFDEHLMTGRASSELRQEFRELDILDDITQMEFEGELDENIKGDTRLDLIRLYRLQLPNRVPAFTHRSIKWSREDPFQISKSTEIAKWEVLDKFVNKRDSAINTPNKRRKIEPNSYIPAGGTIPLSMAKRVGCKKLKSDIDKRHDQQTRNTNISKLIGFSWSNNSCAYDALFTILLSMVTDRGFDWFPTQNMYTEKFLSMANDILSLQTNPTLARETFRKFLYQDNPAVFHNQCVELMDFCHTFLNSSPPLHSDNKRCPRCRVLPEPNLQLKREDSYAFEITSHIWRSSHQIHNYPETSDNATIQQYFNIFHHCKTDERCFTCHEKLISKRCYNDMPKYVVANIYNISPTIDRQISITNDNSDHLYRLRGIIYFGTMHFISLMFLQDGSFWYHDGLKNEKCQKLNLMDNSDLKHLQMKRAAAVIYELI